MYFSTVAQNLLTKGEVTVFGRSLKLQYPPDPHIVEVANIPRTVSEAELKLYFSNSDLTGGGLIKAMQASRGGTMIISYEDPAGNTFYKIQSSM